MILPTPFLNYAPKFLRDNVDTAGQALSDKIDSILSDILDDVNGILYLFDPFRCPAKLLDELGYFLAAGLFYYDSEHTKRIKIATAIQGHKLRGSFTEDAKIKIDLIAGGDSEIIRAIDTGQWVLMAGESTEPDYYWATMGVDGIDDDLGLDLIGDFTEVEVAGNIYIDVDNDSLTADEVQQLVDVLEFDIVPAYMRVYLGYLDGVGAFVEYTSIG